MQRIVTDPAGAPWDVHVEWIGRRVSTDTAVGRLRRHQKQRNDRRDERRDSAGERRKAGEDDRKTRWYDHLDLPLDGEGALIAIGILIAVVLIWVLGPFALALLLGLGEFVLALLAALAVFGWRLISRRHWAVVARSQTTEHSWSISGYRRANRLVEAAADSILHGHGVAGVDPLVFDMPHTTTDLRGAQEL